MPIPLRPPLPDEPAWIAHAEEIDRLRGSVCFNVLVAHFGVRSPRALEAKISGVAPTGDGAAPSGKYRRWWRYGAMPSDDTVAEIRAKTLGAVAIDQWRDLPLYELLARDAPSIARLQQIREAMPPRVRRVLFERGRPIDDRWIHLRLERNDYLTLRELGTLPAFITLLSLAREGEVLGHDPSHFIPSACAFDMLPHVLLATPSLLEQWPRLFACLDRVFFRRVYADGITFPFDPSIVVEALAGLRLDSQHKWRLMAGHRA